jgi:integrase
MRRRNPYPGVTRVVDRHRKVRWRYRRKGFTCYLHGEYGSTDFRIAYEEAVNGSRPSKKTIHSVAKSGTWEELIRAYLRSPRFANLATDTRGVRRNELERLRKEIGDLPVARFDVRHVEALMAEKAGFPSAANSLRKLLSLLFRWGIKNKTAKSNPAEFADKYKERDDGFHTWTDDEVENFRQRWPTGTKPRLCLELALNTLAARGDLCRIGRQNVNGNRISYTRGKTGVGATFPILPELMAELRHVPHDHMLFLTHSGGRPYKKESLGNWFKDRCKDAGLPHCSLHGLRKARATNAANAGGSEREVGALLAHKGTQQAAIYTKKVDRAALTDSAFDKIHKPKRARNR